MKKRFTEEQIAFALRQAESGVPVAEICRKMGITEQTFYRWKKKYGSLGVSELRQLKQLEEENRKLKQLVADLSLDKAMLTDIAKKSGEGAAASRGGGLFAQSLRGQRTAGMSHRRSAEVGAVVQVPTAATGRAEASYQGTGRGTCSLRLQAHSRHAAARGLADQPQARSAAVLRTGLAAAVTAAASACQCCAPAAAQASCASTQRGLEHGLHGGSAR